MEVLQIKGAAAYFIHNGGKRNYDMWKRGTMSYHSKAFHKILIPEDTKNPMVPQQDAASSAKVAGSSAPVDTTARKVMWDPARNL